MVDLFSSKDFNYCFMTVLRILQRSGIYQKYKTNPRKKHNKLYKTPENVGEKWQIDVKYVPRECKASNLEGRFFQYTVLDEATRKRFLYFTKEHSMYETVKCLKNAIKYFKYIPEIIRTDNGFEFSDQASKKYKGKDTRKYNNYLENFLKSVKIEHKFIRPRTPEHNGKVERSHRIDQEKFYRNLKFYSLEDLRYQGAICNKKYNNMRRFALNFKNPNEIELEKMSKNKISYH